jgi:hypothetical protein
MQAWWFLSSVLVSALHVLLHRSSIPVVNPLLKVLTLRAAETDLVPNAKLHSASRLFISPEVRARIFPGIQIVLPFVTKE